jgi:hypothetical protein
MTPGVRRPRERSQALGTIGLGVRNWKKWIGFVVVAVIVVAFGVAAYAYTRPEERELDAQGRAWVERYEEWSARTLRQVNRAHVDMAFGAGRRNARLVEPLRNCTASVGSLGVPPSFLRDVQQLALEACGRAEHAASLNDEFGDSSLAQTKQHLDAAGDGLRVARRTLRQDVGAVES